MAQDMVAKQLSFNSASKNSHRPIIQNVQKLTERTHVHRIFGGDIQNLVQLDNVDVIQLFQDGDLSSNQIQG